MLNTVWWTEKRTQNIFATFSLRVRRSTKMKLASCMYISEKRSQRENGNFRHMCACVCVCMRGYVSE